MDLQEIQVLVEAGGRKRVRAWRSSRAAAGNAAAAELNTLANRLAAPTRSPPSARSSSTAAEGSLSSSPLDLGNAGTHSPRYCAFAGQIRCRKRSRNARRGVRSVRADARPGGRRGRRRRANATRAASSPMPPAAPLSARFPRAGRVFGKRHEVSGAPTD
ncbi:MAG TPA: hypothetical protein VFU81_03455 [Thermomicrobiales bacterium]|nr:hypothetical protein [Thermomicrobiales bacterium]